VNCHRSCHQHVGRGTLWVAALLAHLPATADVGFRELAVELDHGVDSAPVSLALASGPGLLAVGQRDGQWRYSIVSLAGGRVEASGRVPEAVIFYDGCRLRGQETDRVCFLTAAGVSALEPDSGEIQPVLGVASLYREHPARGPAPADFVRDMDGDDVGDFVVPVFEGWRVARQVEAGFREFVLDTLPRMSVYANRVIYEPRAPESGDVDGDGLMDVMFLVDRQFVSYLQRPAGAFAQTARVDSIAAPLATEAQRAAWERDDGQVDQSDLQIEEIEAIRDFNGDGILDLLTEKSISEGVFDRRSELHLYLGQRTDQSLAYPAAADGRIALDGIQFDPVIVDVDGDGLLDVVTSSTRLGLTRIVSALFSGRISVDLDVFRMRPAGAFPDSPDYGTRIRVEFDLETGLTRVPATAIADFDGDGRADLLVQGEDDTLEIHAGTGQDPLFADERETLTLPLPRSGQMVEAEDLNGDGRADLIVRYGPADGDALERTLRVLIAEPAAGAPGETAGRRDQNQPSAD
jgi:hypothetical protein